jgi:Domain of unknown function (DUF6438)
MPPYKPTFGCEGRDVPPLARQYAAAAAVGATPTAVPAALPAGRISEISLAGSACGGRCPVYSATIFADGRVLFVAYGCLPHLGEFRGRIRRGSVERLQELADDIGFFQFENAYTSRISDGAVRHVSVTKDGHQKIIQDYFTAPSQLWAFEVAILHVLRGATWEGRTPVLPTSSP